MVRIAIVLDEYYTSRTIAGMAYTRPGRLGSLAAVLATIGTAALFEALTVLATQDKAVRSVSPWQDDPYDVLVSFTQIIVPALVLVIAVRLPLWRASGAPDRQQETVRAAAVLVALLGLTQAAEWAAVFTGAHASAWNGRTELLIGGLALSSLLTMVVAGLLIRVRQPRGGHGQWRHDWLGDAVLICRRVPVLRHVIGSRTADWVRPRARTVFVTVSVLAAAGEIGIQAVGERGTDPLLIAWAVTVVRGRESRVLPAGQRGRGVRRPTAGQPHAPGGRDLGARRMPGHHGRHGVPRRAVDHAHRPTTDLRAGAGGADPPRRPGRRRGHRRPAAGAPPRKPDAACGGCRPRPALTTPTLVER